MPTANRSYDRPGLDDPARNWMQKHVRVKSHPEWGLARVLRWFPPTESGPPQLRIMPSQFPVTQVVSVTDVEVVNPEDLEDVEPI